MVFCNLHLLLIIVGFLLLIVALFLFVKLADFSRFDHVVFFLDLVRIIEPRWTAFVAVVVLNVCVLRTALYRHTRLRGWLEWGFGRLRLASSEIKCTKAGSLCSA